MLNTLLGPWVQTGEVRGRSQQGKPSRVAVCWGKPPSSEERGALTQLRESNRDTTLPEAAEEKGKEGKGNSQDRHIPRGRVRKSEQWHLHRKEPSPPNPPFSALPF